MSNHFSRTIAMQDPEGIQIMIGRAVDNDANRRPEKNNLLFTDDDLYYEHAKLVVKRLLPREEEDFNPFNVDCFRIYLESLGDSERIVDLESADWNFDSKVIDLKSGDRFGLVRLDEPLSTDQQRGAKIKLRLDLSYDRSDARYRLDVTDVTDQKSPCASRASNFLDSFVEDLTEESEGEEIWEKLTEYVQDEKNDNNGLDACVVEIEDVTEKNMEPYIVPCTSEQCIGSVGAGENLGTSFIDRLREFRTDIGTITQKPRRNQPFKVKKSKGKDLNPFVKKRNIDLYSGSIGFMLGTIGTLGILTAVANMH